MNVGIVGYGAMGKIVHDILGDEVKCIIANEISSGLNNLDEYQGKLDVVIDFSNPINLEMILEYAIKTNTKLVLATTGYSDIDLQKIKNASKNVSILQSFNFSLGINLLNKLVKEITPLLKGNYDIEVIEAHHNKKLDSPSGTAKLLVETIKNATSFTEQYGRFGNSRRIPTEIGIHSIRGGTIVGEHEVMYCGLDEIITLKHSASSKKVFANGAVMAAKWILNKENGLYNMEDVLF